MFAVWKQIRKNNRLPVRNSSFSSNFFGKNRCHLMYVLRTKWTVFAFCLRCCFCIIRRCKIHTRVKNEPGRFTCKRIVAYFCFSIYFLSFPIVKGKPFFFFAKKVMHCILPLCHIFCLRVISFIMGCFLEYSNISYLKKQSFF